MRLRFAYSRATALAALALSGPAQASFLDTDFWCRTYGCVVVHDGQNYDIYDNYQFNIGRCCVPIGGMMLDYYIRAGNTNDTGGLGGNAQTIGSGQSMTLGITGSPSSVGILDDGDGFLDAGDQFSGGFQINSSTDIALQGTGRQYSHSFFISSRNTRFSLRALASIANSTGDFSETISLGDIRLTPQVTRVGNDQGFDFGRRANASNITIVNGVDDLGDLSGTPTQIMQFDRFSGIRVRNGDIDEQTIRLDFLYSMPDYDLSLGVGSLNINVEFDFYREN